MQSNSVSEGAKAFDPNIMVCIGWYKKSKSDKKIFQYIEEHDSIISFDPSQTAFSTVNF